MSPKKGFAQEEWYREVLLTLFDRQGGCGFLKPSMIVHDLFGKSSNEEADEEVAEKRLLLQRIRKVCLQTKQWTKMSSNVVGQAERQSESSNAKALARTVDDHNNPD